MNQEIVRITVRHAFPLINSGITAALHRQPSIQLLTSADDDPVSSGIIVTDYEAALRIAAHRVAGRSHPHLLVVTGNDREDEIRTALHAGIEGYLLHDCSQDELLAGVFALAQGDCHYGSQLVERIADSVSHKALTPREMDVLSLLAQGLNDKLIARDLGIAVATVKVHAKAVYGKLNASSRLQAVVVATSRGMALAARPRPVAEMRDRLRFAGTMACDRSTV